MIKATISSLTKTLVILLPHKTFRLALITFLEPTDDAEQFQIRDLRQENAPT